MATNAPFGAYPRFNAAGTALVGPTGAVIPLSFISLWAGLPIATAVPAGTEYYVTDIGVGGSKWYSDGTRWRASGGRIEALYSLAAPATTAGSSAEEIAAVFGPIPANFLQVGDSLEILTTKTKSGVVDTSASRIRIGSTGTLADAILYNNTGMSTTADSFTRNDGVKFLSGTATQGIYLASITPIGSTTANFLSPAVDRSVPQYLTFTEDFTTGGIETVTLHVCRISVITGGA